MTNRRQRNNVKPEYLRLKEAMVVFGLGQDKVEALAREAKAYYKIDKCVLINYEKMKTFIESFNLDSGF